MEGALLASHRLLSRSSPRPPVQPRTPPPPDGQNAPTGQTNRTKSKTSRSRTTPRQPSTPTTPCAPRKRRIFEYDPSEPTTPQEISRPTPSIPDTPTAKPRRTRKTRILPLDRVLCVPMHVLRAQREDTSALLRPLPRPSDRSRRLVDLSIRRELRKLRAPGCTGILDAAVWVPRERGRVLKGKETVKPSMGTKVGGVRQA